MVDGVLAGGAVVGGAVVDVVGWVVLGVVVVGVVVDGTVVSGTVVSGVVVDVVVLVTSVGSVTSALRDSVTSASSLTVGIAAPCRIRIVWEKIPRLCFGLKSRRTSPKWFSWLRGDEAMSR